MTADEANEAIWTVWVLSWIVASRWSARAVDTAGVREQVMYRVVVVLGGVLLFGRFGIRQRWDLGDAADWGLVAISTLGFAFCWWARVHLGALWSSSVTKKADHRVVDSGPYGIVRHPIYTGIIAAAFATAALKGAPIRIVGALLMTYGFWIKARLEERFLREQLGPEAYDAYRARVPMLLPFAPASL